MKDKLYIIKGTGLSLDGQVVQAVEEVGDYVVVSPPNLRSDTHNTMIKKACLQPLANKGNLTYTLGITRRGGQVDESIEIQITNCPREVSVDTIAEYLETNLTPILRME
jgi:hypothetical protein